MLLNLVFADPYLFNLLCFGVEGVNYEFAEDGSVTYIEEGGYNPCVDWAMGNQFNAYVRTGQDLDVWDQTKAMNDAGIGAAVSDTAGTFVCNHLMYSVLDFLAKEAPTVPGGFIHVPRIPAQTAGKDLPCMELEQIVRGLEAAISAIAG